MGFRHRIFPTPGLRIFLLLVLILLDIILIILLLLMQSGLIGLKLSYGGLGIELNHLTAKMALC